MADYHHYKHELIDARTDRVAVYERYIADLIFKCGLTDKERESSLLFELKHQHGVVQFARLLARKRKLNEDVCALGGLLHDVYVSLHGKYKDHARLSADISKEIMAKLGLFSEAEQQTKTGSPDYQAPDK